MIPHGFRVAAIYRPDTGATVQLNHLDAEGCTFEELPFDGAPADVYGGAYDGGRSRRLSLRFLGAAEYETLRQWRLSGVPVRAVVLASEAGGFNVQWYESTLIEKVVPTEIGGRSQGRAAYDVALYSDHPRAAVYRSQNLLAFLGWADANANGIADGYAATGGTPTFVSGEQRIAGSTGVVGFEGEIVLPFSGVALTHAQTFVSLHASAGYHLLALTPYSFAGASLASNEQTVSATGRRSQAATLPAGTYAVRVATRAGTLSGAGTFAVKDLSLRADASATYTAL